MYIIGLFFAIGRLKMAFEGLNLVVLYCFSLFEFKKFEKKQERANCRHDLTIS